MPSIEAMPYKYDGDRLRLTLEKVVLDSSEISTNVVAPEPVSLVDEQGWKKLKLTTVVSAEPDTDFSKLAPDLKDPLTDVRIAVLVRDNTAKNRRGIDLKYEPGRSAWVGTCTIHAEDHLGPVVLTPVAVRANSGKHVPGVAHRIGEKVAGGPSTKIYIHEPPYVPGKGIDNDWVDFEKEASLRHRSESSHFIDFADMAKPKLLMNEAFKGLRSILELPSRTGKNARFRDVLSNSILSAVLMELCMVALTHSDPKTIDDLGDWQKDLLLELAGHSQRGSPEGEANSWLGLWHGHDPSDPSIKQMVNCQDVLASLTVCIQTKLDSRKAFEKLIDESERAAEADGSNHD